MLNPSERQTYLEALRPPTGYTLDRAIGTTFSLDLVTLLVAPLSMVLFEHHEQDDILHDPIAVLEALRRTTGRFVVFCQQGRIAVPTAATPLYSYLEQAVVEVAPAKGGVFHPKVWALRYVAEDEPVKYRFLCLSRNLTFDRSWDTILCLEGEVEDRKNGFAKNDGLSRFIEALPEMAVGDLPETVREHARLMSSEVRRVRFQVPEGVEDFEFWPMGVRGSRKVPEFGHDFSRLMIVSPFLSADQVLPLALRGRENVLISRCESLDALSDAVFSQVTARTSCYFLEEAAERPETSEEDDAVNPHHDLSGLHAKLYVIESGWPARLLTGSANATDAAWRGKNVEFLVELKGRRAAFGIDKLLGNGGGEQTMASMLRRYQRPSEPNAGDELRAALEQSVEELRQALAGAGLSLTVEREAGGDTCSLLLRCGRPLSPLPEGVTGRWYPVTLKSAGALDLTPLWSEGDVRMEGVAVATVTGFVAFELTAAKQGRKVSIAFVLNMPVHGLPDDRDKQILESIISDRNRFLRYLFFLLAEGSDALSMANLFIKGSTGTAEGMPGMIGLPLLEELVRTSSRAPEKIRRIARLIRDLTQSEKGQALLPEGFLDLWKAFEAACQGEVSA